MGDIETAFLKTQEKEKIQEKERLQELERRVLYTERLHYVTNKINSANNIDEILINLKDDILQLFDVDRLTLYCVDYTTNEIFSKYKVKLALILKRFESQSLHQA
ncbi:MAG: hypothetical protein ACOYU0_08820 [Nitrospirota bacterium]